MATSGYAFYNSYGSVAARNENTVPLSEISEYPRHLYSAQSFNPSRCQPLQYLCQENPRDPKIDYFFGTEVTTHPSHFSHFGYPWCPNGYCVGNHPGRYNTPEAMRWQTSGQPAGMAPEKFYHGKHIDENYVSSPAYNDSFRLRTGLEMY